ncbi:N-acetylmuramoyl-L-alanine amidase [Photorhabdus australis]|nr:N-acetylmuramoyl-L-alanine amidase [Photorhabdus australis]
MVYYVPFSKGSWHAGVSCYIGQEECNDFSMRIELMGTDTQSFSDR